LHVAAPGTAAQAAPTHLGCTAGIAAVIPATEARGPGEGRGFVVGLAAWFASGTSRPLSAANWVTSRKMRTLKRQPLVW
jgi:hypothetical protein